MNVTLTITDADGLGLAGIVPVSALAEPATNLKSFTILIDGRVVKTGVPVAGQPLVYQWDTRGTSDGTHVVEAIAQYKTRKSTARLAVTVNNAEVPPPPPPPPGAGVLGLVPNGGFPGTYGPMAASLKPRFIREDHLSPDLFAWAAAQGIPVILLATGRTTTQTMDLVRYFKPRIVETDNEPYYPTGVVDLATWSRQQLETAKAIKAYDPSIEVIVPVNASANGGDYPTPSGGWAPWVNQMLDAAPTLPQYVDSWAAHPYSNPRDAPPQWALLERVRGQLIARNADRPFSITEVGWSVGTATGPKGQTTLDEQAAYVGQYIDEARTRPWIRRITIYCLRTWGTDFEGSFGLFEQNGTERPAAVAYRARV